MLQTGLFVKCKDGRFQKWLQYIKENINNDLINWAMPQEVIYTECKKTLVFFSYEDVTGKSSCPSPSNIMKYISLNCEDFAEFSEIYTSIIQKNIPNDRITWMHEASCLCEQYLDVYMCKLILVIMYRLKDLRLPHSIIVQDIENLCEELRIARI